MITFHTQALSCSPSSCLTVTSKTIKTRIPSTYVVPTASKPGYSITTSRSVTTSDSVISYYSNTPHTEDAEPVSRFIEGIRANAIEIDAPQ